MTVFCNTTPFISLSSIGQLELLPRVIGEIAVAQAVVAECAWGGPIPVPALPSLAWVKIYPDLPDGDWGVTLDLDRGEQQTVLLARQHKSRLVIIDERRARSIAEYLGLPVTGTLGILAKARSDGLIPSFRDAALAMCDHGIYFNKRLIDRLAARVDTIAGGPV